MKSIFARIFLHLEKKILVLNFNNALKLQALNLLRFALLFLFLNCYENTLKIDLQNSIICLSTLQVKLDFYNQNSTLLLTQS